MKKITYSNLLVTVAAAGALLGCETTINPTLENADPVLVVDAWLNTNTGKQTITLTQTQPYFDSKKPQGVRGAVVSVTNETDERVFAFVENPQNAGIYEWQPSTSGEVIGKTGDVFSLRITQGNEQFTSATRLGRVPQIDSISFIFEEANAFFPDSYQAEFWATDPPGSGDTFWIKAYKNDTLLLRPSEINIAYDAGFSAGGNFDGVTFITPIRRGINPQNFDENDAPLSPYADGDSVFVEIHSISPAAFNFLNEVVIQIDRPGGFSELFASPLANVSTNITNVNPKGKQAVGFFNVAAISTGGKRLVVDKK